MNQLSKTRPALPVPLRGLMALAFLSILFLVGCNKDILIMEAGAPQASGDFFDLRRGRGELTLRDDYPVSVNPILRAVVSDLSAKNATQNFTNNFISRVGYPLWLESKIYRAGPTGPTVIIIPFARDGADSLSGILAAHRDPLSGQLRYNPISRERLLAVTDAEYPQYRYYMKQYMLMNKKIFGRSPAGMSSRICRGEGLLGQYTPPGVINPVECPWRLINLCSDDDRQITYIAGHLPIHLDHDMDGIPNWEDQDWNDFLVRHPNMVNFEREIRDYWEEHMEDLYGEYDDFWDAYTYPELDGGQEIDFTDWNDFWEGVWDKIDDKWDNIWDWIEYQFEPEPDCWNPAQGGSLETRDVRCDWLYVRDCDGNWRNGFDDVAACVGCGDTDDCQSQVFATREANRIKNRYQLGATVGMIIQAGDVEPCWCNPTEYYVDQCVLERLKAMYLDDMRHEYQMLITLDELVRLADCSFQVGGGYEECVLNTYIEYKRGECNIESIRDLHFKQYLVKKINANDMVHDIQWFVGLYDIVEFGNTVTHEKVYSTLDRVDPDASIAENLDALLTARPDLMPESCQVQIESHGAPWWTPLAFTTTVLAADVEKEYMYLKKMYPGANRVGLYGQAMIAVYLGITHTILDVCGLLPGLGEPCDIVNGVLYTLEGEGLDATMSFAGAVPIGGWISISAKYARKYVKYGNRIVPLGIKHEDDIMKFTGSLRENMGLIPNSGTQAHHLIPQQLKNHHAIQAAANARKNTFHMNDPRFNGWEMPNNLHGNHPDWTDQIILKLNELGQEPTPQVAADFILEMQNKCKLAIQNNPGVPINQIVIQW